jgi:hypothetical protein
MTRVIGLGSAAASPSDRFAHTYGSMASAAIGNRNQPR